VTLLERNHWVGGNAGSFELAGMFVDYGSHRLHPTCNPEVLADIRSLLGADLLDRPRHGRIRLHGRWLHFPLKPIDLALRLPPKFAFGVVVDRLGQLFRWGRITPEPETFASILQAGLGRTICRDFYFPYARKVWGLPPEELAAVQAQRRVSAKTFEKLWRNLLHAVPGLRAPGAGRFYYPRRGYGQICQAMCHAAVAAGATVQFGAAVRTVEAQGDVVSGIIYERQGTMQTIKADHIWSTLPVTALAQSIQPKAPDDVLEAAATIEYRAMILVYLVLQQDRFSDFDAHYFPERDIRISRLSEPKNYSGSGAAGRTVLCAELPCTPTDPEWQMSDDELGKLVSVTLERAAIPLQAPIEEVVIRRLRHAYPIYRQGYEVPFGRLDRYLERFRNMISFGRQGLFAHDNTHHALFMAYCAAACLDATGGFDSQRWQAFRRTFETHVVED
jgi:protoporphyrinogen oxidase